MAAVEVGVVLAGGAGRRMGGAKAGVTLHGRPLLAWVADALGTVLGEVVVVARADTPLPEVVGRAVWREPASGAAAPHPLAGLSFALSAGRGVLCCPVDLPFVSTEVLSALLTAPGEVAVADGQPLLGRFGANCGPALAEAARRGDSVRAAVAALSPTVVAVGDRSQLLNVNRPEDLALARARARGGGRAAADAGGRPPLR